MGSFLQSTASRKPPNQCLSWRAVLYKPSQLFEDRPFRLFLVLVAISLLQRGLSLRADGPNEAVAEFPAVCFRSGDRGRGQIRVLVRVNRSNFFQRHVRVRIRKLDSVVGEFARKRRNFDHGIETPCRMSELMTLVPQFVTQRATINDRASLF